MESIYFKSNSYLTLEGISLKELHEGKRRGGGGKSIGSLSSTFDSIHPNDSILDTKNKLPMYCQLRETMWCLTGFYDSNSYLITSEASATLDF